MHPHLIEEMDAQNAAADRFDGFDRGDVLPVYRAPAGAEQDTTLEDFYFDVCLKGL